MHQLTFRNPKDKAGRHVRYWEWRAEAAIFWAFQRLVMHLLGKWAFVGNEKWRLQPATRSGCRFVQKSALVGLFALLHVAQAQQGGGPPALATNIISLPAGPGSIEGLGESFEPQLNTGSYVFRLPFKLPPVRGKEQFKRSAK